MEELIIEGVRPLCEIKKGSAVIVFNFSVEATISVIDDLNSIIDNLDNKNKNRTLDKEIKALQNVRQKLNDMKLLAGFTTQSSNRR